MPIEIRELQIKVTVNQPQQTGATGAGGAAPAAPGIAGANDKLVADAIEQVLEIMRNKNER